MTVPIELRHLEQFVFGDSGLLDEILSIFIDQASMLTERLAGAVDEEAWHSAAHTLKGASRGVGAWSLGNLAERAESLTGPENAENRRKIAVEIQKAADAAIVFARTIRDKAA